MKASPIAMKLLVVLTLAACLIVGAFSSAAGQEPGEGAWSIRPANESGPDGRGRFNWDLDPGASLTDRVSVRNLGSERLSLRVYASDAVTTPDGGFDILPADTPPEALGAWIKFERDVVDLGPGESAVIPFTLTVPANATPGDHPGGIVASLSRAATGDQGAVRLDYRVGLRAYLRVSGVLTPVLGLENLTLNYSGSLNPAGGGDATVTYTVTNTGNVRLTAMQRVRITGPFGITLAESEPSELPQVLPGQSYNASTVVSGIPPALRVSAEVLIEPLQPDGSPVSELGLITARTSVWAAPWTQTLVLVGVVALAFVFWRLRRRRRSETPVAVVVPAEETASEFIKHLNDEYRQEILLVCRGAGGQPDASGAVVTGVSTDAMEIVASVGGEAVPLQVSWGQPLKSHLEMERQLLRLSRQDQAAPPLQDVSPR